MSVYKRGEVYWYEFFYLGTRYRESANTSRKTIAVEAEKSRRLELERRAAGLPAVAGESPSERVRRFDQCLKDYLRNYADDDHEVKSIAWVQERSKHLTRLLGGTLMVPDLDEDRIRDYIRTRKGEGASSRTINMEVGIVARAIGHKRSVLWPKLEALKERRDIGQAISEDDVRSLLEHSAKNRSPFIGAFIRLALLTCMRSGEMLALRWHQVDLVEKLITVGKAKTPKGTGRQIPMNDELTMVMGALADWHRWKFGCVKEAHCVFPYGSSSHYDPTRHATTMKTSWESVRENAGVKCRIHDLRHTGVTNMAEAGVPEETMLAIAGHMSRAMLERYSHIRLKAKRRAVESLSTGGNTLSLVRAGAKSKEQGTRL